MQRLKVYGDLTGEVDMLNYAHAGWCEFTHKPSPLQFRREPVISVIVLPPETGNHIKLVATSEVVWITTDPTANMQEILLTVQVDFVC